MPQISDRQLTQLAERIGDEVASRVKSATHECTLGLNQEQAIRIQDIISERKSIRSTVQTALVVMLIAFLGSIFGTGLVLTIAKTKADGGPTSIQEIVNDGTK